DYKPQILPEFVKSHIFAIDAYHGAFFARRYHHGWTTRIIFAILGRGMILQRIVMEDPINPEEDTCLALQ
ncbi:MAG: hypothetical protein ACXW0L_04720, partial [Methylosarcina sp.]